MRTIKYLTKAELRAANREAEELDYNRQLLPEAIEALPDGWRCPVIFALPHVRSFMPPPGAGPDTPHMRLVIGMGPEPDERAFLDVTRQRYDRLPAVEVPWPPAVVDRRPGGDARRGPPQASAPALSL